MIGAVEESKGLPAVVVCVSACLHVCCLHVCVFACLRVCCLRVCCLYVCLFVVWVVCMFVCVCSLGVTVGIKTFNALEGVVGEVKRVRICGSSVQWTVTKRKIKCQ